MDSSRIDRVTRQQFFALLRAGLWGEAAEATLFASDTTNWRLLYDMARAQAVLGIAFDGMESLPPKCRPPRGIYMQWCDAVARIEVANAQLNRVMCHVTALYQEEGIVPVVLKGQGVAAHYRHPERRQCGDVDIYVSPRHYRRANQLLADQLAVRAGEESRKHASFQYLGVHIENHRLIGTMNNPVANCCFQRIIHRWYPRQTAMLVLNAARAGAELDATISVPPVDFNRIYLLQHAFTHFLNSGIGLRHVCDWCCFLNDTHADQYDRYSMNRQLARLGLTNAARAFTYIAVVHLGLPESKVPFTFDAQASAPLGERLLEDIWCTGNFGQHDARIAPRPEGYWAGKWYTFTRATRRCRELRQFAPSEARWYAVTLVRGTLAIQWNRLHQRLGL